MELRRSSYYDDFETSIERDIKRVIVSSLLKSTAAFAIEYKMGFIKTTDHRTTETPTTFHLPTNPPTTYPPTH